MSSNGPAPTPVLLPDSRSVCSQQGFRFRKPTSVYRVPQSQGWKCLRNPFHAALQELFSWSVVEVVSETCPPVTLKEEVIGWNHKETNREYFRLKDNPTFGQLVVL